MEAYRQGIAWIGQGSTLFHGTLASNLRMAKADATEEELWQALEFAQLADFVKSLPEGLNTAVGERGAGYSGGQKQRLAIARAYLRHAEFVVMDEPTASVDEETEAQLVATMKTWLAGKTLLALTHRLPLLQLMDEIWVLEDGRLVEQGSYEELMARQGTFYHLTQQEGAAA